MTHNDPVRERVSSLRRARLARQGLVAGAVAGSLGIAGALGLSSVLTQGAAPSSQNPTSTQADQNNTHTQRLLIQNDDGEGDDGGGIWVPAAPSQQFSGGGSAPAPAPAPHATSGGS